MNRWMVPPLPDLQPTLQPLVLFVRHPVVVWVSLAPRLDVIAVLIEQDRIVVIPIVDGVAVFGRRKGFQI
jgi:hypothetical protein